MTPRSLPPSPLRTHIAIGRLTGGRAERGERRAEEGRGNEIIARVNVYGERLILRTVCRFNIYKQAKRKFLIARIKGTERARACNVKIIITTYTDESISREISRAVRRIFPLTCFRLANLESRSAGTPGTRNGPR